MYANLGPTSSESRNGDKQSSFALMSLVAILSTYFGMIYSTVSISYLVAKSPRGAINSLEDLQKRAEMGVLIFKDSIIASLALELDS